VFNETEEKESLWSPTRLQFQESTRLAIEILSALRQAQRRTLEMFFFEGLTLKEIAQRRNESFSNVRHHYYRGLEKLRFYMENGVPEEGARPSVVRLGEA